MLPTPNLSSSGNENDSDDFAIINTPSPQPIIPGDNSNTNQFISKIKESEETDDFEHLSMDNLSHTQINKPPLISDNDTSGEQSEFDFIDIPSNINTKTNIDNTDTITEFQVIQESQSDDNDDIKQTVENNNNNNECVEKQAKESITMTEDKIIDSPINHQEISPMITATNNWSPSISAKIAPTLQTNDEHEPTIKSIINLSEPKSKDYGEQKLEILRLSPSQSPSIKSDSGSPKGTMDEIINLTEPFNSSSSRVIMDGPTSTNEEEKPLINEVINHQNKIRKKKKKKISKREYERYIRDKSNDNNPGCNGYLCCRMQNDGDDGQIYNFFENMTCFADLLTSYMDKCFGGDHFDDEFPQKPYKKI